MREDDKMYKPRYHQYNVVLRTVTDNVKHYYTIKAIDPEEAIELAYELLADSLNGYYPEYCVVSTYIK
jgi:hypothetical protein